MTRVRVVGWNVQPVLMVDDGEQLTPLQVTTQLIPAAQWQDFKNGGDEAALDTIRAEVEQSSGSD